MGRGTARSSNQAPNNATHKQNKRHINKSKQNVHKTQQVKDIQRVKKPTTDSNVI